MTTFAFLASRTCLRLATAYAMLAVVGACCQAAPRGLAMRDLSPWIGQRVVEAMEQLDMANVPRRVIEEPPLVARGVEFELPDGWLLVFTARDAERFEERWRDAVPRAMMKRKIVGIRFHSYDGAVVRDFGSIPVGLELP